MGAAKTKQYMHVEYMHVAVIARPFDLCMRMLRVPAPSMASTQHGRHIQRMPETFSAGNFLCAHLSNARVCFTYEIAQLRYGIPYMACGGNSQLAELGS